MGSLHRVIRARATRPTQHVPTHLSVHRSISDEMLDFVEARYHAGLSGKWCVGSGIFYSMSVSFELSSEDDRERIQYGFPPHRPAYPYTASRIKDSRRKVEILDHGSLIQEMTPDPDGPAVERG